MTFSNPEVIGIDEHHSRITGRALRGESISPPSSSIASVARYRSARSYMTLGLSVYDNVGATSYRGTPIKIISNEFLPQQIADKDFVYMPPFPTELRKRRDDFRAPRLFVHSFGLTWERGNFGGNVSVPVDRYGYNPARMVSGITQLITPSADDRLEGNASGSARAEAINRRSIHHIISRRGDIYNMAGWNFDAFHANTIRSTIGVELSVWYVLRRENGRIQTLDKVVDLVPYSTQQILALAFILRKLQAWNGASDDEMFRWLGPKPNNGVLNANTFGCLSHYDERGGTRSNGSRLSNKPDPAGGFRLPVDYQVGQRIPAGVDNPAQFQRWVNRWYGSYRGRNISAWYRLFEVAKRIRKPSSDQIFDTSLQVSVPTVPRVNPRIVERAIAGVSADADANTLIAGIRRAAASAGNSRAAIYAAASNATAAVRDSIATREGAAARVYANPTPPMTMLDALGFDYDTGQWVRRPVVRTAPGLETVTAASGSSVPSTPVPGSSTDTTPDPAPAPEMDNG